MKTSVKREKHVFAKGGHSCQQLLGRVIGYAKTLRQYLQGAGVLIFLEMRLGLLIGPCTLNILRKLPMRGNFPIVSPTRGAIRVPEIISLFSKHARATGGNGLLQSLLLLATKKQNTGKC